MKPQKLIDKAVFWEALINASKVQQRINKISKFSDIGRQEFENMSDETFEMFLSGIEKQYNERIEAEKKAELDRIEKEKAEIAERERIRLENEKLKKEAEQKAKELEVERQKAELEKKAIEEKAKKELEESERILLAERKVAEEKLRIQMDNARKLALEIEAKEKAQKDAEAKALKEKQDAELRAKKEAEKLAKAPVKKQLTNWVNLFEVPAQSPVHHEKVTLILQKFESFKDWAKKEIESL